MPDSAFLRRRIRIGVTLLLLMAQGLVLAAPSSKKGVGTWSAPNMDSLLKDVGVSWFYTWSPKTSIPSPSGCQFVPMVWNGVQVTAANLADAKSSGAGILLTFNEPDNGPGQADMTPAQALQLWKPLMDTGLRLGSPAVAGHADAAGSWQDQFMFGAKAAGYRVDFMCLHWYGDLYGSTPSDPASQVKSLKAFLESVHNKYGKPIWITEFALVKWDPGANFPPFSDQARFVELVIPMLESLPYLERYAWYAMLPNIGPGSTNQLYEADGTLTVTGAAYRNTVASSVVIRRIDRDTCVSVLTGRPGSDGQGTPFTLLGRMSGHRSGSGGFSHRPSP